MGSELRALVVGSGFEPLKAEPADLQSAPIGRSGNPPGVSCASVRVPQELGAREIMRNLARDKNSFSI